MTWATAYVVKEIFANFANFWEKFFDFSLRPCGSTGFESDLYCTGVSPPPPLFKSEVRRIYLSQNLPQHSKGEVQISQESGARDTDEKERGIVRPRDKPCEKKYNTGDALDSVLVELTFISVTIGCLRYSLNHHPCTLCRLLMHNHWLQWLAQWPQWKWGGILLMESVHLPSPKVRFPNLLSGRKQKKICLLGQPR